MSNIPSYTISDGNYELQVEYNPNEPELINHCTLISTNRNIESAVTPSLEILQTMKNSAAVSLSGAFRKHKNLKDIRNFCLALFENGVTRIVNTSRMFQSCINLTDITPLVLLPTRCLIDTSFMFSWCCRLKDLSDLSAWDVSHIRNIHAMFLNCTSLRDISPLSSWELKHVKKRGYVFCNCNIQSGAEIMNTIDSLS